MTATYPKPWPDFIHPLLVSLLLKHNRLATLEEKPLNCRTRRLFIQIPSESQLSSPSRVTAENAGREGTTKELTLKADMARPWTESCQ
jgi:hypothetical protein